MSEPVRRRRILVTGGTGTLGYNILSQLAGAADYTVIAPVRNMHRVGNELRGKIQFIEHELGDPIHTAQIFERANPDVIVHCAASGLRLPRTSWFDLMQFNVESTMRLFQMNCALIIPRTSSTSALAWFIGSRRTRWSNRIR